jgi:hypothetical protein
MTSVRERAGWWWRPAADGRLWPVSCEEAGPQVTGVVHCDLVVLVPGCGLSGQELGRLSATHGLPSLGQRWLRGLVAPRKGLDPEANRGGGAEDQQENNDPGHNGFFLPPSLPAWRSTTTVAGPAWESSALACHTRHPLANASRQGVAGHDHRRRHGSDLSPPVCGGRDPSRGRPGPVEPVNTGGHLNPWLPPCEGAWGERGDLRRLPGVGC